MPMIGPNALFSNLLDDKEVADAFGEAATLKHYIAFEVALAYALEKAGLAETGAGLAVDQLAGTFQPDVAVIAQKTSEDGVTIPEFVRQFRAHVGETYAKAIHTGATSQDVMDTATVLSLKETAGILSGRIDQLNAALRSLCEQASGVEIMGRTRMQAALPIPLTARIDVWQRSIAAITQTLDEVTTSLPVQLGGAVGTRHAFGDKGQEITDEIAGRLGLVSSSSCWHAQRDILVRYADVLSRLTGSLAKLGQDVALMVQQGVDELTIRSGGSSSAMPHKRNPVKAEVLVSLGRYNAIHLSGMHQAVIHEQERSGAAWTLEWMILPSMCMAAGKALSLSVELVKSLDVPKT
ncbi:3-carboxy-cis,cis-muconate cycloisomerase [Rhodobacteraceae bacterium RKSG542]|uniref:3-carboxy-cis,cis-muconate cycloisomerase n=1 Tax=Pseudovibrio flavus TaxID=2529854 RepID=UPI0012BBCD6C|nr:3-carboxy-cis,cis-muconate cycloisomerase [Pseudovibrio flavus]MTI18856.1 3-carboxy-cis,cis-muconate cycloisomerase [Pseudovibrio flavus]